MGNFRLNRQSDPSAPGAQISFVTDTVEDVDSALQRAVGVGASLVLGLTVKPWGQTVAYVRDCNGYIVEICSPVQ